MITSTASRHASARVVVLDGPRPAAELNQPAMRFRPDSQVVVAALPSGRTEIVPVTEIPPFEAGRSVDRLA